jgi:hypothetical protein
LEVILKAGATWKLEFRQLAQLRRRLLDGEGQVVCRLLELLRKYGAISDDQLYELTRTPSMKRFLSGYTKPRINLFGTNSSAPAKMPQLPTMRSYWKRHWSQG